MSDDRFTISFGDISIGDGIQDCVVEEREDRVRIVNFSISNSILQESGVDYSSEITVIAGTEDERTLLFTGMVDSVFPGSTHTAFSCVSRLQLLAEMQSGGLGISKFAHALETVWSVLRTSGLGEDRIGIEGFTPGPLEVFEVSTPIDGLVVSAPLNVGNVTYFPKGLAQDIVGTLGPDELRHEYVSASCWAATLQTALTLFQAEENGLADINLANSWLAVHARYTTSVLPTRRMKSFNRKWARSQLSRRDVVVVRGLGTGRAWLRATSDIPNRPILDADEQVDLKLVPLPDSLPIETRAAILTWRRASEESDALASIVALWEAIEFYASGANIEKLFSKGERNDIEARACEGLDHEKGSRVRQLLDQLNSPSLMHSLTAALRVDGVPVTADELELLRKVRKIRNDFVHGRNTNPPRDEDVIYAKAIVNRMLVYRVFRINSTRDLGLNVSGATFSLPSIF